MTGNKFEELIDGLIGAARIAGDAILQVHAAGATATAKGDGSPVTEADRRAEAIVLDALAGLAPDIAVVSEENSDSHKLTPPQRFFLVDPLDGTRDFIAAGSRGHFTVNIALIERGVPVLGVVHAPAHDRCFSGIVGQWAREDGQPISIRDVPASGAVAVASVSHRDEQTDRWLRDHAIADTCSVGSSLKFCLVATGEADVYPRFGPTSEWDTAAGHAVLAAAGGSVENPDGSPFMYGKPNYLNGAFIARGSYRADRI